MTALTQGRNTPYRDGKRRNFAVAAAAVIYQGAMVALNSSDNLVPASTSTTLSVVGRAQDGVDNTNGIAGAERCEVDTGIFLYANSSAGDLIAASDIGSDCFAVDDQTVALTNGGSSRSVAGKIFDVDANGVWVQF